MKAINLRCEYLYSPIGIDVKKPRLMWNCEGGTKQKYYEVILYEKGREIWDSNKIESEAMYIDLPISFTSRQKIACSIYLWDENNIRGEQSTSTFEMGLLTLDDWKAKWICGNYKVNKNKRYPVDYFRKIFNLSKFKVARLYITSCGLYETHINNVRVGDFIFAPGSTDYRKRIQYQTYDVTSLLKKGENTIDVELADGWYRGSNGAKGRTNTYGAHTKLIFQLEVYDENDNLTTIVSDESVKWSDDGPIRFADLKDGEIVDANYIPTYNNHAIITSCETGLVSSNNVFVKEHEIFNPIELIVTPSEKKILRFSQNISGYISFNINAKRNQKIYIKLGELIDENGELTLKNIQCIHKGKKTPLQEIHYTCAEGNNIYKSKFFYGGFMYAQIDTDIEFKLDDFKAIAVYSDFKETSKFECSNKLINQFYKNTIWSLKSNSTDFPSDCPTRERMGWTGDSQIFFNTASFLVDYASFARKHIKDIYDRQWKSGRLPQIVPYANEDWFMWVMNGSVGWACAGVYIPYYFYKKYNDKRILENYYNGMLKYANFMIKRAGKWGGIYSKPLHMSKKNRKYAVNRGQSYGEWAEPNDVMAFKWYDFASPHPEESTAYTYFTLKHVLEIADILGKEESNEIKLIKEYCDGAKNAYQELVTKKDFLLDTNRQAKLVRPLYMGLLSNEQTKYAKDRLLKAMDNYNWRLGTGFLSTPFILYVLASIDSEYAYKILENEKLPGWLFMPKNGATTIWEAWEGNMSSNTGIASLNHYSKGAMVQWLFEGMCGINILNNNRFEIKPIIGGNILYAKAEYESIYGKVSCSWRKKENSISVKVLIPSNCKATITLQNGKIYEVTAGSYEFTY